MLNQRQRTVLARLLTAGDYVAVAGLASGLGVSTRTVRHDLSLLRTYLAGTPLQMEQHKQYGVRLVAPPGERDAWRRRLQPREPAPYRLSPEERQWALLAAILLRAGPVSLGRLAAELGVSRRTLTSDLKAAETWLAEHDLRLVRSRSGVSAWGDEQAWRQTLAALADDIDDRGQQYTALWDLAAVPPPELGIIKAHVERLESRLGTVLTDVARRALVFHLAVAAMRVRGGHCLRVSDADFALLAGTVEFRAAGLLAEELGADLGLQFPPAEWGYIALHLLGAKALRHDTDPDDRLLTKAVHAFVEAVSGALGVDVSGDAELVSGLLLHLRPTVHRLRHRLRVVNPLRTEISERYAFLLTAVKAAAPALEQRLDVAINDDELAFLALHVGAALERHPQAQPRVLVICTTGIGTARLLTSRLRRSIPDLAIVDVIPASRLTKALEQHRIDLIISTVPIVTTAVPVVVVNPFLPLEDIRQIWRALPARSFVQSLERVEGPVLSDLLVDEMIQLDLPARDWEEAIRLAGQPLVRAGVAEPRYVTAMIEMVRQAGPYMVVDAGVAMPHARPEDGVHRVGFSLLRLQEPVAFGHPVNDPVRLVFCLASPDAETHLRALQQLAEVLGQPRLRHVLEHGSSADIQAMLQTTACAEGGE